MVNVPRLQHGATYLLVLFAVAILSASLAAAGNSWSFKSKRIKEGQLIYVGNAYRRAIGEYYEKSPGFLKRYPRSLDDLLLDKRYVYIRRYLRKRYRDPILGTPEWGEVRAPDGGIMGVYSKSEARPIRTVDQFVGGSVTGHHYSDWQFVYAPDTGRPLGN